MPQGYAAELHADSPTTRSVRGRDDPRVARAATAVFLVLCAEVLFSVPYRTIFLATHSPGKSWVIAVLGLLFCGAVYAQRHRLFAAIVRVAERLPRGLQSAGVTVGIGLALRLLWVLRFHPPLASDGAGYFTEATNLAQRHFLTARSGRRAFRCSCRRFLRCWGRISGLRPSSACCCLP